MKTAEEILLSHGFIDGYSIHSNTETTYKEVLVAMEEYAAQFKQTEVSCSLALINKMYNFLDTYGTVFPENNDEREAIIQRELFKEMKEIINAMDKQTLSFTCSDCHQPLTEVRPGKHQCDNLECVQNKTK